MPTPEDKNFYTTHLSLKAILIFVTASLLYCYAYAVQVIPSALSHELMDEFTISTTQLGLLSSGFYWSYTLMQLPGGLFLDKYGSRVILVIAMCGCAFGTLLFSFTNNIQNAIFARIVMGACAAVSFSGVIFLIVRWIPPNKIAMFAGILQMLGSFGAIMGGALLARIMQYFHWRDLITCLAIIGFVMGLLMWLVIRNSPARIKLEYYHAPIKERLKLVIASSQSWFIGIYAFAIWAPILAFAALWGIPFLVNGIGISKLDAAIAIGIIWIGIGIGSPLAGWISDHIKKRCAVLTTVAIIGLISISLVVYFPHMHGFLLYTLLFFVGVAGSGQTLTFGVVKDINTIKTTGTANGFNNMWVVVGGVILQPFIGILLDHNWDGFTKNGVRLYNLHDYHISLIVLPACFLIAAIMSAFFIKETYCGIPHEYFKKTPRNR